MKAQAIEICWWIIICDKTRFIYVHLLILLYKSKYSFKGKVWNIFSWLRRFPLIKDSRSQPHASVVEINGYHEQFQCLVDQWTMVFHRVSLSGICNKILRMILTCHSCACSTHCIIINNNNSKTKNINNKNNVIVIVSTRKLQYLHIRMRYKTFNPAELKTGNLVTRCVFRTILTL